MKVLGPRALVVLLVQVVLVAVPGSAVPVPTSFCAPLLAQSATGAGGADTIFVDSIPPGAAHSLAELLSSRVPGVVVQQASGSSGTGARIRLRGSNSVFLPNDPLVIVDGIRISADLQGSSLNVGGQAPHRLGELNLDDVDRVVILRGPSHTAMYGTGASNGVIEITTKRSTGGASRWRVFAEAGQLRDVTDYPANFLQIGRLTPSGNRIAGCNIDLQARRICAPVADSLLSFSPLERASPYRSGVRQSYGVSTTGEWRILDYYVAGDFENEEGVYSDNGARGTGVRANLGARLRHNLSVRVAAGYRTTGIRLPMNDNNILGVLANGLLGFASDDEQRGYLLLTPEQVYRIDSEQDAADALAVVSGHWRPFGWLRIEGALGVDEVRRDEVQFIPGDALPLEGLELEQRTTTDVAYSTSTASARGSVDVPLGAAWRSTTVIGVERSHGELRSKRRFTVEGEEVSSGQDSAETVVLGGYLRQTMVWRDKVIASAGIRGDDPDVFERAAPTAWYPSAGITWLLSRESFFPRVPGLNELRLRAAYGEAGQVSGVRSTNRQLLGRVLGAEETREIEAGIDASLLSRRLNVDLTYYDKRTLNAIALVPSNPPLIEFGNALEVMNRGVEAMVSGTVLARPDARWSLAAAFSHNRNEVVSAGDALAPLFFGFGDDSQRIQEGYPLGGYWARRIVSASDLNGDGIISRVNCPTIDFVANPQVAGGPACEITLGGHEEYLGSPFPTTEVSLSSTLRLFGWLQLYALVDHRGGMRQYNASEELRCVVAANCRGAQDAGAPAVEQSRALARLMGTRAGYIEDASFWKLREVAVTLAAPASLARRLRASSLSLTLAGRNLATWTDYSGGDPEVNMGGQLNLTHADVFGQPPVRHLTARLAVEW